MGLSSSIFSSEPLRGILVQSGRTRVWHALIATSVLAFCWLCTEIQVRVFRPASWNVPNAEILFIGSSHVGNGVVANDYARPTGLLWFPAMTTGMARAAFEKHWTLWPALKLVLIEVDEWTLFADAVKFAEDDFTLFAGRLQLNAWELPDRGDPWGHFGMTLENLRQGRGVTALHRAMRITTDGVLRRWLGFEGIFPSGRKPIREVEKFDFNDELARSRVAYLNKLRADSPEINIQAIAELARRIRETGARVALITFPMHEVYNRARPDSWDDLILHGVERVRAAQAPDDVPYWNFRDHPGFRDTTVYKNQDHLNPVGARALAEILKERVADLLAESESTDSNARGR